jgi:hypothetical protein
MPGPVGRTLRITGHERKDMTKPKDADECSRACGCYAAAERLILGQYRMTTQGKDVERAAKDRYDVAVAYIELVGAVRNAIAYSGGRESEWGERAEECFRMLERGIESA